MGNKQIRIGQLIAPFGPGSLYTDRKGIPHVICGLDHWFRRTDAIHGTVDGDRTEFQKFEPRLAALLHVDSFFSPPDFRPVRRGSEPPPNAMLPVPAHRFPTWYRHTATGELHKFNLDSAKIDRPAGGGRWQPVRFVAVCEAGHLSEFPWKEWIGCTCPGNSGLRLIDRGGSELSSIQVDCQTCPPGSSGRRGKSLSGTTVKPENEQKKSAFEKAGICCPGDRPWLGRDAAQPNCGHALIGALINQTNLYFPRTISAILLPDLSPHDDAVLHIRNEIEKDQGLCGVSLTRWRTGDEDERSDVAADIKRKLIRRGIETDETAILKALASLFEPSMFSRAASEPINPESDLQTFRRAEFNILRHEVNDTERIPNLRVIPAAVPPELAPWFAKVNLVERLRETRVFYGFDRLDQSPQPLEAMPGTAMEQLFRTPPKAPYERWLPAVEVFGEGIYLELQERQITEWQSENEGWIRERLDDAFVNRLAGAFQTLPPLAAPDRDWASRYLLVHSLSHILINQLVFECGYSTAALRERLYISSDSGAPMAGILIYTAAGDSEGTMGGLVRLGRPERLEQVVRRALSRASWCSADPVCSENLGGQGPRLANLAACHACILLPETSCETVNHGLDRSMIVGTPEDPKRGMMADLIRMYAPA